MKITNGLNVNTTNVIVRYSTIPHLLKQNAILPRPHLTHLSPPTVDRVGLGGQPGVHLEPAVEGDRAAAVGPHGHGAVHGVPPHREHRRVRRARERQDHQALEERYLIPVFLVSTYIHLLTCLTAAVISEGFVRGDSQASNLLVAAFRAAKTDFYIDGANSHRKGRGRRATRH